MKPNAIGKAAGLSAADGKALGNDMDRLLLAKQIFSTLRDCGVDCQSKLDACDNACQMGEAIAINFFDLPKPAMEIQ